MKFLMKAEQSAQEIFLCLNEQNISIEDYTAHGKYGVSWEVCMDMAYGADRK